MENINKTIGKNLMQLRKHHKLTQLELAEKFNYTDKSISKWENGESLPSIEVLYSLAQFYGVTLDSLTSEDHIIHQQTTQKKSKDKLLPIHLVITLLAICAVWVCATGCFVGLKISLHKNFYIFFMWAVPISCIIAIIFNSIWGKSKYLFIILSILIWSTITSFYLQFLSVNLWPLFILGIPLQVVVIVCGALVAPKKPKSKTLVCPTSEQVKEQPKRDIESKNDEQKPKKAETSSKQNTVEELKSEGKIEVTLPQIHSINENKKA